MTQWRLARWLALAWVSACLPAAAAPEIVVSIKPIHALVAGVTADVTTPTLLMDGAASPHDFALRPSHARRLARADVVIWVGESLEAPLAKAIAALSGSATVVTLMQRPDLKLLPRRAGDWAEPAGHGPADPHLWLDPDNAIAIVGVIESVLAGNDPPNASRYAANAARLRTDIAALEREIAAMLAPIAHTPFAVFHDAYQYFERHFNLSAVGAIVADPERRPGARRLAEIRATIGQSGARCVFTEPQFQPSLVHAVAEGSGAHVAALDPLGAELPAGTAAYFTLMRDLAGTIFTCLSD